MNKKELGLYITACIVTIIFQILLAVGISASNADTSVKTANIAVIALTLFMLFMVKQGGGKVDPKKVRFERYSIWVMPLISAVWWLSRVFPETMPDTVKVIVVVLTVIVGTVGIVIAIRRTKLKMLLKKNNIKRSGMAIQIRKTVCVSAACALALTGCGIMNGEGSVTRSFFAMDTYMTITVCDGDKQTAADECAERIGELEKLWSVTGKESDISRVNESTEPVEVSTETAELLRFALGMCESTDGALDITLYPVLREWGFTTGDHHVPEDKTITDMLERTGAENIKAEGRTIAKPDGFMIDIGSVGKGAASDEAANILRQNGVTSALIDLGGNIYAVGKKTDGGRWKIGMRDPDGEGLFGTLEAEDCAVITSGGYERYFEQDGVRYWHILDPKTGRPARSGLISATVTGSEGRLCDALSTAFFVMGEEKAAEYYRANEGFEMILVTEDGRIMISEGLEGLFAPSDNTRRTEVIRRER